MHTLLCRRRKVKYNISIVSTNIYLLYKQKCNDVSLQMSLLKKEKKNTNVYILKDYLCHKSLSSCLYERRSIVQCIVVVLYRQHFTEYNIKFPIRQSGKISSQRILFFLFIFYFYLEFF